MFYILPMVGTGPVKHTFKVPTTEELALCIRNLLHIRDIAMITVTVGRDEHSVLYVLLHRYNGSWSVQHPDDCTKLGLKPNELPHVDLEQAVSTAEAELDPDSELMRKSRELAAKALKRARE